MIKLGGDPLQAAGDQKAPVEEQFNALMTTYALRHFKHIAQDDCFYGLPSECAPETEALEAVTGIRAALNTSPHFGPGHVGSHVVKDLAVDAEIHGQQRFAQLVF